MALLLGACFGRDQAGKSLQAHIGQAQTASQTTAHHISDFKATAGTIDYKASRAKKLWQQGIEKPF